MPAVSPPAARPLGRQPLSPGTAVILSGLTVATALNGAPGLVVSWSAAAGRYRVRVRGEGKMVRPACLTKAVLFDETLVGRSETLWALWSCSFCKGGVVEEHDGTSDAEAWAEAQTAAAEGSVRRFRGRAIEVDFATFPVVDPRGYDAVYGVGAMATVALVIPQLHGPGGEALRDA